MRVCDADWMSNHPGGAETVLVAAGRECTNLLKSYHPFSDNPERCLKSMEVCCERGGCRAITLARQIGTVYDSEFVEYAKDKNGGLSCCSLQRV